MILVTARQGLGPQTGRDVLFLGYIIWRPPVVCECSTLTSRTRRPRDPFLFCFFAGLEAGRPRCDIPPPDSLCGRVREDDRREGEPVTRSVASRQTPLTTKNEKKK
jgi:hypothetical protein